MRRIQRKRTRGWRMPSGTKYVGRPTKWGNPYPPGSLAEYRRYLTAQITSGALALDELRGFDALACWCRPDGPCHADILIDMMETTR